MSDDFLRSSPSRIDPLLYTYSEDHKKKLPTHSILQTHTAIHTPESKKLSKSKSQMNQKSEQTVSPSDSKPGIKIQPANQPPSYPPSASKLYSQFTNLTGWTPLISKTYANEPIIGFDATPNGSTNSFNKFLLSQQMGTSYSNNELIDGFSLTPCLNNHTINSIQNQLNNLTPFNDKTLHLADFFMESPINQTPIKDLQTITPSKFRMSVPNSAQKVKLLDTTKSSTKRSIALVDTPPRLPQKLSMLGKDEENEENNQEINIGITNSKNIQEPEVTVSETPKKPLSDITNKPKVEFQTPANQKLHAPSSPSTIVVVSPMKTTTETTDEEEEEGDDDEPKQPPSPTPQNKTLEPRMGIFSERKSKSTTSNQTKSKKANPKPEEDKSKANKAKMQAGMNKFQIIFTDVHTLMNNKTKKVPKPKDNNNQELLPPTKDISKEHSSISHNSMNSSHLNISTDHSSFELEGNDKFFLDKVFDKQSPQYYGNVPGYGMPPPPPHAQISSQVRGQPSGPSPNTAQQQTNMMMLMSTPQHSNVYGPGMYSELSPYSFGYPQQQPKFDKE